MTSEDWKSSAKQMVLGFEFNISQMFLLSISVISCRIVVNSEKERLSIAFFFNPAHHVSVEPLSELIDHQNPPKYRPYNYGKFFATRKVSNFKKLDVENIQLTHSKYYMRWGLLPPTKKLRECAWKKLYIQISYVQMQAAKRSQTPLPSQVNDDRIILDKTLTDQVSIWKSSRGLTDKVVLDHDCSGETRTYYQIGDVFVCEKTRQVHVCDDTCREAVLDPTNELLVCTISGHCFDRFLSPAEMEPDTVDSVVYLVDAYDKERFAEAKNELDALLSDDSLANVPFLILGNKIDIPYATLEDELRYYLGLTGVTTIGEWKKQANVRSHLRCEMLYFCPKLPIAFANQSPKTSKGTRAPASRRSEMDPDLDSANSEHKLKSHFDFNESSPEQLQRTAQV
ncbi:hypothetical protein TEA_017972 [Camellia sinensis var. sinensis]|uniref:Uncharacterized protein n=1 Tax=Camellia sinensis var. sinensis TaxID=542762 RepID=A0A4S4EYX5_CAMSN|nr:hypothetical protein TEA_017972 [Camellia sinensis var. sinensis]